MVISKYKCSVCGIDCGTDEIRSIDDGRSIESVKVCTKHRTIFTPEEKKAMGLETGRGVY